MVATIQLRDEQLTKFCRLAGIKTDDDLATRMKVNPATVSRTRGGKCAPGAKFIAGLLDVFGTECFVDLFVVAPDEVEDAA